MTVHNRFETYTKTFEYGGKTYELYYSMHHTVPKAHLTTLFGQRLQAMGLYDKNSLRHNGVPLLQSIRLIEDENGVKRNGRRFKATAPEVQDIADRVGGAKHTGGHPGYLQAMQSIEDRFQAAYKAAKDHATTNGWGRYGSEDGWMREHGKRFTAIAAVFKFELIDPNSNVFLHNTDTIRSGYQQKPFWDHVIKNLFVGDSGRLQDAFQIADIQVSGTTLVIPDAQAAFGRNLVAAVTNAATLSGTLGDDLWVGANGVANSFIDRPRGMTAGQGGLDSQSHDLLVGGNLNDTIDAGVGFDIVFGQAGNDSISGGAGNDALDGGIGNVPMCSASAPASTPCARPKPASPVSKPIRHSARPVVAGSRTRTAVTAKAVTMAMTKRPTIGNLSWSLT